MTLIISAVTSKKIYQVSDTRLTMPNGDLFDDFSIKTTLLQCKYSSMSISYTGIAHINNLRTDEWLVKILTDFHAFDKNLFEVLEHIKNTATIELKKINFQNKHLLFVLLGFFFSTKWMEKVPFIAYISNCHDETSNFLKVPLDHFNDKFRTVNNESELNNFHLLRIHGMLDATKEIDFREKVTKFCLNKLNNDTDPNDIVENLVKFVRIAASHKKYGKYINKYCLSVHFEINNPQVNTHYHNLDNEKILYMPNFITKIGLPIWGFEANFTGDPIGPVQRKNPFS